MSAWNDAGRLLSVENLVTRRAGDAGKDPWNLALVQRDRVWTPDRMRHLLDSLLAGYPIGALMLCSLAEDIGVIDQSSPGREVKTGVAGVPQLVDGQQRVNALFSLFASDGGYGRFLVDATERRHAPEAMSMRGAKARKLRYIVWVPAQGAVDGIAGADIVSDVDHRERYVDLSRWYNWTRDADHRLPEIVTPGLAVELLRSVDPDFASHLDEERAINAADFLRRLIRAWRTPFVPVIVAEVAEPADILEVFTRINLEGVPVNRNDVYFAAVKTFWPDAEHRLSTIVTSSRGLLDRLTALSLVSRLASRGLGLGDMVPLNIDRLSGEHRDALRAAIDTLLNDTCVRIAGFAEFLATRSHLGLGLRNVNRLLWEEVFAWVAMSSRVDASWYQENLHAVERFLLGASLFSYPQVMGDAFRRASLLEALAAGVEGRTFPTERIVQVARHQSADLKVGRSQVRPAGSDRAVSDLANASRDLVLSVSQRLVIDQRGYDWDHIVAQARRSRMRMWGASGRQIYVQDSAALLNSTGNFWAMGLGTNRALGQEYPRDKFALLRKWRDETKNPRGVWDEAQWALTADEEQAFASIGELLEGDRVDEAMTLLRDVVPRRGRRLLGALMADYSLAEFASDTPIDARMPIQPDALTGVAEAIGVAEIRDRMDSDAAARRAAPRPRNTPDAAHLALPPRLSERADMLVGVFFDTTRAHTRLTDPRRRAANKGRRDRALLRYVPLRGPVEGAYIDVVLDGARAERGAPFWVSIVEGKPGASIMIDRLRDAGRELDKTEGRTWTPLNVNTDLDWGGVLESMDQALTDIRTVIEPR